MIFRLFYFKPGLLHARAGYLRAEQAGQYRRPFRSQLPAKFEFVAGVFPLSMCDQVCPREGVTLSLALVSLCLLVFFSLFLCTRAYFCTWRAFSVMSCMCVHSRSCNSLSRNFSHVLPDD